MNEPTPYTSAKKDFRRRLLLRFAAMLPLIFTAYVYRAHQYGLGRVPHALVPIVLLPLWFWVLIGFGSAFGAAAYSDAFRCPRCGELYRGGLRPASNYSHHKRGCCVSCGLCLFQKDKTNWWLR